MFSDVGEGTIPCEVNHRPPLGSLGPVTFVIASVTCVLWSKTRDKREARTVRIRRVDNAVKRAYIRSGSLILAF